MTDDIYPEKTVTEDVVEATSRHEGRPPLELPRLAETIGTEELDSIFESMTEKTPDGDPQEFCFEYSAHSVTVYETGTVEDNSMTDRVIEER